MNILEQAQEIFKSFEKYYQNEKILTAKLQNGIESMDPELLEKLLENEDIKNTFFVKVKDNYIFDKAKFIRDIDQKQYLESSYTQYENKIGLSTNRHYLNNESDVVLDFPYKDCVLVGGATKEDDKRNEVFINEIIGREQINNMSRPKVLTNAKRYTKDGIEENITEFKNNDNLIIKGNNYIALQSLLPRYEGKIKCIYIDPPYNTGNDDFNYNDSFNHSSWLVFMKNRLEIAKKLLANDGSIYIQIDNNENHYLKILLDEIFGRENFQREIIWVLKGASGYKSLINNYVRGHDTILFYTKTNNYLYNKNYLPYTESQIARFSQVDENGRRYKTITKNRKFYLDDAKGVPITDVWDDIASFQTIVNSPEKLDFQTQKPEKLMSRIIECSSNIGDYILDFCMGSGTTCAVAHKMGRRYIGIEQIENQIELSKTRLDNVIKGDQSGISSSVNWQGGGSFVYCELKEDNQKLIDEIQNAPDEDTLQEIKEKIFNSDKIIPYLSKKDLEEVTEEFDFLPFETKQEALIKIIDKNRLYLNYCDMEDEEYNISDNDKEFSKSFYKDK